MKRTSPSRHEHLGEDHMTERTLLARLASPAGFVLVLLLFGLPFIAVACEYSGPEGKIRASATYTGVDLVVGGEADLASTVQDERLNDVGEALDPQPLVIAAVVLIGVGAAATLLRPATTRLAAAAGVGTLAAALLFAGEWTARGHLQDVVRPLLSDSGETLSTGELVQTRYGFWIALLGLLGVALGNAVALTRALRPADDADDGGGGGGSDADGGLDLIRDP
jgi:hypothetical protein